MVANNIDVMSTRAECGDHWKLQKKRRTAFFEEVIILSFSILFNDQTFCKGIITTDMNLATKGALRRDLDVAVPRVDGGRLEIVLDGLLHFSDAQLAFDTTVVFHLHRDGRAIRGAASTPGVALRRPRRKKERTYPANSLGVGGVQNLHRARDPPRTGPGKGFRFVPGSSPPSAHEVVRECLVRVARWTVKFSCLASTSPVQKKQKCSPQTTFRQSDQMKSTRTRGEYHKGS